VQVTVKLFATLRTNRFKVKVLDYSSGTTILDVARDLDIPKEELALTLVNGISVEVDHEIRDGDTLSLFPPVGGG
jgi:molybdopterin converting factor small subunit